MSEDNQDSSQKTEQPTEKRLSDAIKKGQVVQSKDFINFFSFFAFVLIYCSSLPKLMQNLLIQLKVFIAHNYDFIISEHSLGIISSRVVFLLLSFLFLPFLAIIAAIIFAGFILNGKFIFSSDPIAPKLERISLLSGIKRIFSTKSLIELLKGIVKIAAVGIVIYLTIAPKIFIIKSIYDFNIIESSAVLFSLIKKILTTTCIVLAVIGIADFIYQKIHHLNSLKMSKQDIKDEHKNNEGNPEIKAKLRQLRLSRSNKRMIQSVPEADVILTNPTHYSVALKYNDSKMNAPVVIAKGLDLIALHIREIAKLHKITIVENPALTRALYKDVEVGKEIPIEYYQAVAEVINYINNLKNK